MKNYIIYQIKKFYFWIKNHIINLFLLILLTVILESIFDHSILKNLKNDIIGLYNLLPKEFTLFFLVIFLLFFLKKKKQ